ncbi:methyl-accepting chemotaxis protein [Eubacteriaceae bacterium ES3]|nr:methyl-accepting chemotaxis protein [Eubacteriaceae bacterium ES3]
MSRWISDLKIRTKLLLSFLIVALVAAIVGFFGVVSSMNLSHASESMYNNTTIQIASIGQISTAFEKVQFTTAQMLLEDDPDIIDSLYNTIADESLKINSLQEDFLNTDLSPAMQDLYEQFLAARELHKAEMNKILPLITENNDAQAIPMIEENGSLNISMKNQEDAINQLMDQALLEGSAQASQNVTNGQQTFILLNIITVAGIIIALVFAFILRNLICRPLQKTSEMIKTMRRGSLSRRLRFDRKDEIGDMAKAMDEFADDLQNTVIATLKKISDGDVSTDIEVIYDEDEILPALKETTLSIRGLINEVNSLSQSAVIGELSLRSDTSQFNGAYQEVLTGFNNTLDSVIDPLFTAIDYTSRIGKGEIPPKITADYPGDFNAFKESINACIDGLSALEEGNRVLGLMSQNDLSQTVNSSCCGIYAEIASSINIVHQQLKSIVDLSTNLADGDLRDLEQLKEIGRRSENDEMIPAMIRMLENVQILIDETRRMTKLAIDGNLTNRGNSENLNGEYKLIIEGFNQTLDATLAPILEASTVLAHLSLGDLSVSITGQYLGDHNQIKNDLNHTIAFLKTYVEEITSQLTAIGNGNFNVDISNDYLGDFAYIKTALSKITDDLTKTMTEIEKSASQVESGAHQISDGSQQLSQGASEQSASIQELSASIEEILSESRRNADNASEANKRATEVQKNAQTGNRQMEGMVTAMSDIDDSSQNISKIIKVIDDIAFQTNILALNAAVEAARAGSHGKGFAVVAEEVRALAARSAEAAKQTSSLIEGSIEKVSVGTKIADETAESLSVILAQIEKVTELVGNIAADSNHQADEIMRITQGIEQVSRVVQSNSETAEESAVASEELSNQADILKSMVDVFELKNISCKNTKSINQSSLAKSFSDKLNISRTDSDNDKY